MTPTPSAACDVLVIGGGPAGSTAACLLAERGHDVVVLEKSRHPRFHIGESLLPANLPLFERLGIADAVRRIGVFKPGAEFVSDLYGKSNLFYFASAPHLVASHSYQVKRADFDDLLFRNCAARGARTIEDTRVVDVAFEPDGLPVVSAVGADGERSVWRPRFVIDASGRDTVMASKLGWKDANKRNNTAAIYGHFTDVIRREGEAAGVITVHLVEDGWFWMIPLADGVMSVGLVSGPATLKKRTGDIEQVFRAAVAAAPSVAERMKDAQAMGKLTATGNYAYISRKAAGERFLMVGDAFTFVDPIFSSGVMVAMTSGALASDAVDGFLTDPQTGLEAIAAFDRRVRKAVARLSWLIYRINDPVMRYMLMHPTNRFGMRDGLMELLAGQIFGGDGKSGRGSVLLFKLAYYGLAALTRIRGSLPPSPKLAPES